MSLSILHPLAFLLKIFKKTVANVLFNINFEFWVLIISLIKNFNEKTTD